LSILVPLGKPSLNSLLQHIQKNLRPLLELQLIMPLQAFSCLAKKPKFFINESFLTENKLF
jgi:hypothetical protein